MKILLGFGLQNKQQTRATLFQSLRVFTISHSTFCELVGLRGLFPLTRRVKKRLLGLFNRTPLFRFS